MQRRTFKLFLGIGIVVILFSCKKTNDSVAKEQLDSTLATLDTITSGELTLVIDPQFGCRIISFQFNNVEMLTPKNVNNGAFGSTFWPSPQSIWGWPPIAEIDTQSYTKTGNKYSSGVNSKYKFLITKEFKANQDTSISIIYTITNKSDSIQKVAPWVITRVPAGGITFFKTDEKEVFEGVKPFGELKLVSNKEFTIFKYDSASIDDNKKSFAFAKTGWLAQLNGPLIFVTSFPNINKTQAAPNESEIEIYANPNKKYIEIENQGAYTTLLPSDSTTYEVKWYLRNRFNSTSADDEYLKVAQFIESKVQAK